MAQKIPQPSNVVRLDGSPAQQAQLVAVNRVHALEECLDVEHACAAANAFLEAPQAEDYQGPAILRSALALERDRAEGGALRGDWLLFFSETRLLGSRA